VFLLLTEIFEAEQLIDVEDVACYNQFNGLQETPIVAPEGPIEVNGICKKPECSCPALNTFAITDEKGVFNVGSVCDEAMLDVQMLAAVSGGTKIRSLSYFGDDVFEEFQPFIERK